MSSHSVPEARATKPRLPLWSCRIALHWSKEERWIDQAYNPLLDDELMAWTVLPKLTNRWTVKAVSNEASKELQERREAYHAAHPKLFRSRAGVYVQGVHLPINLFPAEARLPVSTREPPDFLTLAGYGVSERVKKLFEQLEPNIHQFVEVPTFLRNGDSPSQRYYALALGHVAYHQIDNVLTTMRRNSNGKIEPPDNSYRRGRIAINRDETTGWHAWFSADIYNYMTISDELHSLFLKHRIPGLDYVQLSEPD